MGVSNASSIFPTPELRLVFSESYQLQQEATLNTKILPQVDLSTIPTGRCLTTTTCMNCLYILSAATRESRRSLQFGKRLKGKQCTHYTTASRSSFVVMSISKYTMKPLLDGLETVLFDFVLESREIDAR
jgi:hypothetical protein